MAKFFDSLIDKLQGIADLEVNEVAFKISQEKQLQDLVIRLNSEGEPTSHLYELGEDSLGKPLKGKTILRDGEYRPFTITEKRKKGQKTSNPTLKDSGSFYNSFMVVPYRGGFEIKANPFAGDTNLFEELGSNIVGLNDSNLQIVIDVYKNKFLEEVEKRVRA